MTCATITDHWLSKSVTTFGALVRDFFAYPFLTRHNLLSGTAQRLDGQGDRRRRCDATIELSRFLFHLSFAYYGFGFEHEDGDNNNGGFRRLSPRLKRRLNATCSSLADSMRDLLADTLRIWVCPDMWTMGEY
jgi:hypothetical protein